MEAGVGVATDKEVSQSQQSLFEWIRCNPLRLIMDLLQSTAMDRALDLHISTLFDITVWLQIFSDGFPFGLPPVWFAARSQFDGLSLGSSPGSWYAVVKYSDTAH